MTDKFLTLERQPNGVLSPVVDNDLLIGHISTQVANDQTHGLVTLTFDASRVHFRTAQAQNLNS